MTFINPAQTTIPITAVWLRREGDTIKVLVEIDSIWRLAITEYVDCPFSHIAEGNGVGNWPSETSSN